MFAGKVTGNGTGWDSFSIVVEADYIVNGQDVTIFYPGSLIGEIGSESSLSLKEVCYNSKAVINNNNDDSGLLCNNLDGALSIESLIISDDERTIENDAKIEVGADITSINGSAGGLIGCMDENSS